ncbi:MAG: nucleotide exchange factor GrpE [Rhodospirillales bacterium]|nr:nucleotide exchange factor GrpE [Rhodospirillales bacterium]
MTDESAQPAAETVAQAAEAPPPAAETPPDPLALAQAEIVRLSGEMDSLKRAAAEAINRAKRIEREAEDKVKYALVGFARDLLGVGDNLRRALESLPAEQRVAETVKGFYEGVEMTERALAATFEKYGVKMVPALDQRFDPNLHQAMFEVEDLTRPSGQVVQVMQAGYVLNDRLIRPALVGVSKGGPKAPPAEGGVDTVA